jgi:hypothetical protein
MILIIYHKHYTCCYAEQNLVSFSCRVSEFSIIKIVTDISNDTN